MNTSNQKELYLKNQIEKKSKYLILKNKRRKKDYYLQKDLLKIYIKKEMFSKFLQNLKIFLMKFNTKK
jgi:hypothetical protein